jgi:hypothetical protein
MTGSQSRIKFIDYSEAYAAGFEDMQRRVPDISKIAGKVGWKPNRTLDDILTDVIQSFSKKVTFDHQERETSSGAYFQLAQKMDNRRHFP